MAQFPATQMLWLLLAAATPVAAAPGDGDCTAALADADHSFAAGLARILASGAGSVAQQCAALTDQIGEIERERELHLTCVLPSTQRDRFVAQLTSSGDDFRRLAASLDCSLGGTT